MNNPINIIGHGLAGSILALNLIEREVPFRIYDDSSLPSSSLAAAGLFNPVTGKVMKPTWKANTLFPFLINFYRKWQSKSHQPFFNERRIIRPFTDAREANDWTVKSTDSDLLPLIEGIHGPGQFPHLHAPYGSLGLQQSGWLDTRLFIDFTRALTQERGYFNPSERAGNMDKLPGRTIYCTGTVSMPEFLWLPFRPVKGEVLRIRIAHPIEDIYNRGVFVIPDRADSVKVGATYDWDINWEPTAKGKSQLFEKFRRLTGLEGEVIDHWAGVRPATKDRRPIIGPHPADETLLFFGGWGSKGVSLLPYFASRFADYLTQGKPIEKEVSIDRFYPLYKS